MDEGSERVRLRFIFSVNGIMAESGITDDPAANHMALAGMMGVGAASNVGTFKGPAHIHIVISPQFG